MDRRIQLKIAGSWEIPVSRRVLLYSIIKTLKVKE